MVEHDGGCDPGGRFAALVCLFALVSVAALEAETGIDLAEVGRTSDDYRAGARESRGE